MESAHPIPQNVTAFQFRLIGDMTLKQFMYLSVGIGIAYLTFILFAASLPILAWPVTFVSALLGIAFAFVPISDRPLDHWLASFLRAVYSPTKRIWSKNGKKYNEEPLFIKRLAIFSSATTPALVPTPVASPPIAPQPQVATPAPPQPLPSPEELKKTVELAHQAQTLKTKIIETERQLGEIKTQASTPGANPQSYTPQINEVLSDLNKLINEAGEVKKELEVDKPKPPVQVTVIPSPKPRATQIVLTTFPNVVNGIVVDSAGNYLESVVVVIYDKEGLPTRALKTNKLGQFSGSTPLPNGTYTIQLEKDNLLFDSLQIELVGKVMPPLQIAAKKIINAQ